MINKLLVLIFALLTQGALNAQSSSTPYSSYGIGEASGLDHGIYSSLGNNQINYFSETQLNFYNPASYTYIRKQLPLFSTGISSRISTFSQNNSSYFTSKTNVNHFAFGLSFAKHFGLAFGLSPYSAVGYDITNTSALLDDSIVYNYKGTGSIQRFFVGLSANILKLDSAQIQWTVGANMSSIFGSVNNDRSSTLASDNGVGGISKNTLRIKSFHYELGTYLRKQINDANTLSLSATLEPLQQLNAYQVEGLFFSTQIQDPNSYQLISETPETKGKITIAPKYAFGADYTLLTNRGENNKRNGELKILASYSMQDWTKFESNFGDSITRPDLKATSSINLGIQFTPNVNLFSATTPKFLERTSYRVGFYQKTLPYSYNGTQLSEFGTTFGFGIPILTQQTESSIHFGVTYGKRGTIETGSLNETFVGINFGVIIAPSRNDKWFVKRKLD